MAFVAVYDANVLYPNILRDVLIRVAGAGLVQAKWTETILDETFRNLRANRPDLAPDALGRTRRLMKSAVRDCLVKGYEPLIDILELPDKDDRHVLAAAVRAKAQVIVTFNLKDFPRKPWLPGTSRPSTRTRSSKHRSTWRRRSCTERSSASPTAGRIRRARSPT